MLKYDNYQIVFREFPDEVTLAINLTMCPNRCRDCHSPQLREDYGTELTRDEIDRLVAENKGITCIGFMGGDNDVDSVLNLSVYIHGEHGLITGWYSGKDAIPDSVLYCNTLDYVKVGHYDPECGSIDKRTTNQRMYHLCGGVYEDVTPLFWKEVK